MKTPWSHRFAWGRGPFGAGGPDAFEVGRLLTAPFDSAMLYEA